MPPERVALRAAFAGATAEMGASAAIARDAIAERRPNIDSVPMAEQLTIIANDLEGDAWAADRNLTHLGRDGAEVAARMVGIVALWRNAEPYVGLTNKETDNAINAAAKQLLRTLRRNTRGARAPAPDGPDMTAPKAAAKTPAPELRRAAALFSAWVRRTGYLAGLLLLGAVAAAEPDQTPVERCLSCHVDGSGSLDIVRLGALDRLPPEWPPNRGCFRRGGRSVDLMILCPMKGLGRSRWTRPRFTANNRWAGSSQRVSAPR